MKKFLLALAAAAGISFAASAGTPAAFPGGKAAEEKYITENVKYPSMAKENGIEGVVFVVFTVKADGTIGNIKIKRMVDPDLEGEAIRLVKQMPAWTPATDDSGKPIESVAEIKVPFILE